MDFNECWEKHLNKEGDVVTLEMIERYGINGVWQIARLAWEMSRCAAQQVDSEAAEERTELRRKAE